MSYDLIKKLPKYYRNSRIMLLLLSAGETALDEVEQKIKSIDAQCLVATADTSLSRWEQIFGLPNSQDGVERRRERLLARKRGSGGGTRSGKARGRAGGGNGSGKACRGARG